MFIGNHLAIKFLKASTHEGEIKTYAFISVSCKGSFVMTYYRVTDNALQGNIVSYGTLLWLRTSL